MNPVSAYIDALHKYFDYQGTVSRREYWMFVIAAFIIQVISSGILFLLHKGVGSIFTIEEEELGFMLLPLFLIYLIIIFFAVALPGLALMVRRLNDMGWSRWWLVLVIVFMIPFPRLMSFIPGMSFIILGLSYISVIIFGCVPSKQ